MSPGYHFFASAGYLLVHRRGRIVYYVLEFKTKQLFIHKPDYVRSPLMRDNVKAIECCWWLMQMHTSVKEKGRYVEQKLWHFNSLATNGAFHQRRSSLNQVQIWPWPQFSPNFCCSNAVQIKSRVELGLTLNRRGRWIKLWSSVQLALNSGPRIVIPTIFVQIGDNSE